MGDYMVTSESTSSQNSVETTLDLHEVFQRSCTISKKLGKDDKSSGNIQFTDLTRIRKIGGGGYGKIELFNWNGKEVVLKTDNRFSESRNVTDREYLLMATLNHKNIVNVYSSDPN